MIQKFCINLFEINHLVYRQIFHQKKTFNLEFSCVEVCFTDEKSKPLKIKDKLDITLVIS